MIRPNKVSEIRSIGSSTRLKGISETADIKSNARWFDLQESILRIIFATDQSFLHNVGVEYSIACRSAIASSDFMLDAIGSQWDRAPPQASTPVTAQPECPLSGCEPDIVCLYGDFSF
jgi:hypothetical protein